MRQASYLLLFLLLFFLAIPFSARATVVINEVAWMGTTADWRDEWVELANIGTTPVAADGWMLSTIDGELSITLSGTIAAGGFYLIERTDDSTLPDIAANLVASFGKGGLANGGEVLVLKNASGAELDNVDGSDNWAIGGNNGTKETLQRITTGWITASPTPKAVNVSTASGGAVEEVTAETPSAVAAEGSAPTAVASGSGSVPAPEPQIFASAGEDKIAIVGADATFSGTAFGKTGELISRAQYLWTFGDGSWARGAYVRHVYRFPGEYITVLNVSEGDDTVADQLRVRVEPNQMQMSEIFPGSDSWTELANNSDRTVDISQWGISLQKDGARVPEQTFWFPDTTRVLPHARVIISSQTLGFNFPYLKGVAELLYPNGTRADTFLYSGAVAEGESFQRVGGGVFVAAATPAAANAVPAVVPPKLFIQPAAAPTPISQIISTSNSLPAGTGESVAEKTSDIQISVQSDFVLPKGNAEPVVASAIAAATELTTPSSRSWLGWAGLILALGVTAGIAIAFARRGS